MMSVLTLFIFVNYLDRYALSVLVEPIKHDLGLSDTQVDLLTGAAFALVYSCLAIPVARLAEHRNRVHVLLGAIILWSLGTMLCGLAGGFVGLFLARMLVGAGESGAMAPAQAIIGDSVPIDRRGTAFAIFSFGAALGAAVAPMLAGLLEVRFGWRGALLALGLLGAPVAVLLALTRDSPRPGATGGAPPPVMTVALRRLLARRSFVLLVPAMVALGLGEYSLFLWLPSYFARMFHDTTAAIGAQLTLFQGVPLLAGTLLGGVLTDRLIARDRRWLAWLPGLACALVALSGTAFFLSTDHRLALMLLIVPSLCCGVYVAPMYASVQAVASPRSRATATAVMAFAVNLLGLGLGPVLIGGTSDILEHRFGSDSLRYAFFLVPPLYVVSALMFALAARYLPTDIRDAQAED